MKRNLSHVIVLLIAGALVSCGGGGSGDSPGGGAPIETSSGGGAGSTPVSSDPGTPIGSDPGTPIGSDPGAPIGSDPGSGSGSGGGTGTLPSAGARIEETDAAVSLSAGWSQSDPRWGWSGGTAVQSATAGTLATFTFTGTSVRWIGSRSRDGGIALVRVDGGPPREIDLFARPREVRTPILTIYGLSSGPHTLTIEVTGRKNPQADSNIVVVDAFEVEPPIVSHLQETDPDVTMSAGWVHLDDPMWSGGGVRSVPDPAFGGARMAEAAGEKLTLKFRGTSIGWIGYRGPDGGIARVQLDGGPVAEVDTYSPKQKIQELVFTASGLTDTTHTLTIEATGRKNDASTAAKVIVDAFDVTTPGRRYQEADPAIVYTGAWTYPNVNRVWSEGAASTTTEAGARATFSFTGTSVTWIGCEKSSIGRARVYVDGAFVREVNMYRKDPIEGYQRAVFRAEGLTDGPHTLTIEAVGGGGFVVVDAFDVLP